MWWRQGLSGGLIVVSMLRREMKRLSSLSFSLSLLSGFSGWEEVATCSMKRTDPWPWLISRERIWLSLTVSSLISRGFICLYHSVLGCFSALRYIPACPFSGLSVPFLIALKVFMLFSLHSSYFSLSTIALLAHINYISALGCSSARKPRPQ